MNHGFQQARRTKGEAPRRLWFRLYTSILKPTDKTRSLSDRAFRRWLLYIAAYQDAGGLPPTTETLALCFGCSKANVISSLSEIARAGLLELTPDGYHPHDWDKMQYESDTSADRTRRWREKKLALESATKTSPCDGVCDGQCDGIYDAPGDVTVTPSEYRVQSTESRVNTHRDIPVVPENARSISGSDFDASDIATEIHNRHPKGRKGVLEETQRNLAQRLYGAVNPSAVAEQINQRHIGWCSSRQWRDGRVMGLTKWLTTDGPGTCMSDPPDEALPPTAQAQTFGEIKHKRMMDRFAERVMEDLKNGQL